MLRASIAFTATILLCCAFGLALGIDAVAIVASAALFLAIYNGGGRE
jgi:hypothetical protein